jgi:hypothetical protein
MRRTILVLALAAVTAAMMAVAGGPASAQTYYSWCGYDYYGY